MNRTQIVLLVAVLGLAAFYSWSKVHKLEEQEAEYQAKRYFPQKKEDDIEVISVACTDPKFAYQLRRNGDRWYLDGHLASQEKSPQLVMSLIELSTEKEVAATPSPGDDKEFGLDNPTYTISLTGNGGEDLGTVILGDRTPGANHYYGRWKSGGAISTVPAYTLSPLEEEPKDLREASPFPVQPTAVDRFDFVVGDQKAKLQRPEGKDEGFDFQEPHKMPADESKLTELMYLLKDLKVARFLDDGEKTELGTPVALYRAHEAESKVDLVVELCQPVAVNPKLRYGRRFLTDPGKSEPRPGTEERFVIELVNDSKALLANVTSFEDRRLVKLDVDKVQAVKLTTAEGSVVQAERLAQGGWRRPDEPESAEDQELGKHVDKLLWAVRDLRYADDKANIEPSGKGDWQTQVEMKDGTSYLFRFGAEKSGKPFVGFGEKSYLLQEALLPALDEAAKALASGRTPVSSPTPAP